MALFLHPSLLKMSARVVVMAKSLSEFPLYPDVGEDRWFMIRRLNSHGGEPHM